MGSSHRFKPKNSKPHSPVTTTLSPAIKAKAERIVQRLRDIHKTGQRAKVAQDENDVSTEIFADQEGLNAGTLRRWKKFAELYSVEPGTGRAGLSEFDILCALRRPNGLPLHWGYLPYLLSVMKTKTRREMAQKAADEGWSPARLHAEIREKEKRPRGHGRSVTIPTRLEDGHRLVLRESELWLARAKKLVKKLCSSGEGEGQPLDPEVEAVMIELAALLKQVQGKCTWLLKLISTTTKSRPKATAKTRRNLTNTMRPTRRSG